MGSSEQGLAYQPTKPPHLLSPPRLPLPCAPYISITLETPKRTQRKKMQLNTVTTMKRRTRTKKPKLKTQKRIGYYYRVERTRRGAHGLRTRETAGRQTDGPTSALQRSTYAVSRNPCCGRAPCFFWRLRGAKLMVIASSSAPRDGKRGFRRRTTKEKTARGAHRKKRTNRNNQTNKISLACPFSNFPSGRVRRYVCDLSLN